MCLRNWSMIFIIFFFFLFFGFCCYSSYLCVYFGNPQRLAHVQILPQQPVWCREGNPGLGLGSGVTRPDGTVVTSLNVPPISELPDLSYYPSAEYKMCRGHRALLTCLQAQLLERNLRIISKFSSPVFCNHTDKNF